MAGNYSEVYYNVSTENETNDVGAEKKPRVHKKIFSESIIKISGPAIRISTCTSRQSSHSDETPENETNDVGAENKPRVDKKIFPGSVIRISGPAVKISTYTSRQSSHSANTPESSSLEVPTQGAHQSPEISCPGTQPRIPLHQGNQCGPLCRASQCGGLLCKKPDCRGPACQRAKYLRTQIAEAERRIIRQNNPDIACFWCIVVLALLLSMVFAVQLQMVKYSLYKSQQNHSIINDTS